jgi:hypothetical protein
MAEMRVWMRRLSHKRLEGAINYKDEAGLRPERGTVSIRRKPMKSPWTVMPKFSRPAATGGVYFWCAGHSMHCHGLKRCESGDGPFLRRQSLRPASPFLASRSISSLSQKLYKHLRQSTTIYDFKPSHGILYTIYPERSEVLGTGKPR